MTNATKAIPEVDIEFDGKTCKLLFSCEAFCHLEELTGKNALDGDVWDNADTRLMTAILWAGLHTHHPEYSLQDVRRKLDIPSLVAMYTGIKESMKRASPEEKKSEEVVEAAS